MPRWRKNPRADEDPEQQSKDFVNGVGHVALMRPSELVVRYLEVSGARSDGRQWAGVFICVDDAEVRNVFASSEPPAHDDWIPDRIEDKQARRIVRQTVNTYIPQTVRTAFALATQPAGSDEDRGSLAAAADAFAGEFLQGDGTAPAPPGPGGAGPGGSRGARLPGPIHGALA